MNVTEFYTPIKEYFEKRVAAKMGVKIDLSETHSPFPKDIGMAFVGLEDVLDFFVSEPDLVGTVSSRKERLKLLSVNIKTEPLTLFDLSKTRLFSEVIKSDFSFLISTYDFKEKDKELLQNPSFASVKNYYLSSDGEYLKKEIVVGKIEYEEKKGKIEIKNIDFDTELSF